MPASAEVVGATAIGGVVERAGTWRALEFAFHGGKCRELGVSEQTYYRWRNQFGGLKADDAKRLKELEKQDATLKRLLAEAELEKAALKELAEGNWLFGIRGVVGV